LRQRVALVAMLARLYVGVVLIDRERECRGHRRRIVGVMYDQRL
jgi:nitrate reductase beta subunit